MQRFEAALKATAPAMVIDHTGLIGVDTIGGRHATSTGNAVLNNRDLPCGMSSRMYAVGDFTSSVIPFSVTNNWTVAMWMRTYTVGASGFIACYLGSGASNGYGMRFTNSAFNGLAGGIAFVTASIPILPATSYFLALRRSSNTWQFLVNGIQQAAPSTTTPNTPVAGFTYINQYVSDWDKSIGWNGFWDRVLSDQELHTLYLAGRNIDIKQRRGGGL